MKQRCALLSFDSGLVRRQRDPWLIIGSIYARGPRDFGTQATNLVCAGSTPATGANLS